MVEHVRVLITSPAGSVERSIVMSTSVCVCLSVCLSVREHISWVTRAVLTNFCACCLWPWLGPAPAGWQNPKGKGQFWVFSFQLTMHCNAFATKEIIQSPITSRSRRDHSVCHASANRNPENSERRRCGLSGMMGVHSAGEVWYLRLPCLSDCRLSVRAC